MNENIFHPSARHSEQPAIAKTGRQREEQTPQAEASDYRINPRILHLIQERDAAERRLQEAMLDVAARDNEPDFQTAQELFGRGLRAYRGPQPDAETTVWLNSEPIAGYEGRPSERDLRDLEEELEKHGMNLPTAGNQENVLNHLAHLTEEAL
jgi:hypothetical protein